MKKQIDLKNDSVRKSFYRYLLPAISAMIIKSLYVLVDAMFVGVGVGAEGLGAISISVPFFSISSAVALTVGIGGASLMSIELGKGNEDKAQGIFSQSMVLIFAIVVTLVTLTFIFVEDIVALIGAEGSLALYSIDYLKVMLPFFIFHGLWWVLSSFVRNDTNPSLVMYATISSAIANVVLDYLFIFVFKWGVKGAAFATGLSQMLTFIILLGHFRSHKGMLKLSFKNIRFNYVSKIMRIGIPTFFVESTAAATVFVFNYVLLRNYSPLHVSAYGIVMNVGLVGMFMLIGIGQACQPIMSFNFGAERYDRVKEILLLGLKYGILVGAAILIVTITWARPLAKLFTTDDMALVELATSAMAVYFLSPPIMAFNAIVATLFQSTLEPKKATVIAISRGFVFVVIGLLVLPIFFPINGVWGAILFAEAMTAIYSGVKLLEYMKSHQSNKTVKSKAIV